MKTKEVMTANDVQYCTPDTKLVNAVKSMKAGNCGALPVIDKSRKVVGLVTDRDIALSLMRKQVTRISEIMSTDIHTVRAEDDLSEALRSMRLHQVGRIPVTDEEGRLAGMLSVHNLLTQQKQGELVLGKTEDSGENLLKTLQAITARYSYHPSAKKKSAQEQNM